MKEGEPINEIRSTGLTRRNFLQVALLGGGATLLASMLPADVANAAGKNLSFLSFRIIAHDLCAQFLLFYAHITTRPYGNI